jgi:regulatory protein
MNLKQQPTNQKGFQIVGRDQELKQIKQECLRLLARREHSQLEIKAKLAAKGFDRDMVMESLADLTKLELQSDLRYAESYANFRSQKGFGPVGIAFDLRQQGIDADTVERVLKARSDAWMTLLESIYAKKYLDQAIASPAERAKRTRFLLQRGFPSAMVSALLKY